MAAFGVVVLGGRGFGFFGFFTESASEFFGFSGASATTYRCSEDVRIIPVVIPKLKFRDVQRQIFAANFVEAAHDAALQERPEAIDRLSMDRAVDILAKPLAPALCGHVHDYARNASKPQQQRHGNFSVR